MKKFLEFFHRLLRPRVAARSLFFYADKTDRQLAWIVRDALLSYPDFVLVDEIVTRLARSESGRLEKGEFRYTRPSLTGKADWELAP